MDAAIDKAVRLLGWDAGEGAREERDVRAAATTIAGRPVPRGRVHRRLEQLQRNRVILAGLLESPGIPQRTDAWYAARQTMVTASELQTALGPRSGMKQYYSNKIGGNQAWNALKDRPAIQWGVKFECVACEVYVRRTGSVVHEFGLLLHPTVPGFGASPDGVTDMGVMLEIKCPYSRTITGEVSKTYLTQIQAQLDTTGLPECDFLECKFREYEGEADFVADVSPEDSTLTRDGLERGALWKAPDGGHEVSPACVDAVEWARERPGATFWRLDVYHCQRVARDPAFMASVEGAIAETVAGIRRYAAHPELLDSDFPGNAARDAWTPAAALPSFAFIGV